MLIGQSSVWRRLCGLADSNRIPHALLLCGPEGAGKFALAQKLAYRLIGQGAERSTDLHYTFPTVKMPWMGKEHKPVSDDFATEWHEMIADGPYFSIEQWMRAMKATTQQAVITVGEANSIEQKLSLTSMSGGYKVSLIWLPERMNEGCANKLLKLIEEPPERTVFIMACQQPELLLETIRSRTQRIDIPPIAEDDIARALQSEYQLSDTAALRNARLSGGSWLKAQAIVAGDGEDQEFFAIFRELMRGAWGIDLARLRQWADKIAAFGREKQKRLLAYISRMVRESFIYNFHDARLSRLTEDEEAFVAKFAPFVNEANIIPFYEILGRAQRDIAQNANAKIVFFDLGMRTAGMVRAK